MVAAPRPGSMTGKAYLKAIHNGIPWTTTFEDEAAKMTFCMVRRSLASVARCFHGYGIEAA